MKQRTLGNNGPLVSAIGLGCMGMSQFYGPTDDKESMVAIWKALDLGVSFLDTADVYGNGHNETLVGKAISQRRSEVFLCTKFGARIEATGLIIDGRPAYVTACCEASLRRLGVETIDLYYQHRLDRNTPIEETVAAMADLVRQGKVRYLGLSEVSPATLERAYHVHPIHAVQSEYSLWTRDPEQGVLSTCRKLGVAFVPFSPLGRGFLTGAIRNERTLAPGDRRHTMPRFQGENLSRNIGALRRLEEIASRKKCSAGQLAIAWLLAQGNDVIPIPGTRKPSRVAENAAALSVELSAAELAEIGEAYPPHAFFGERFQPADAARIDR